MRFPLIIFGLCSLFVVSTTATEEQSTPFWDMIPGIAQGKSLVQLIFGDKDGAVKTQEHFLNEGLGSSQLRSAYFLVTGEPKKALDIQEKFFSNLEGVVDGTPVVGHVKGGLHLLAGDHEHGWSALKTATSTTGAVVGGLLGGPAGAIGGHILTDAFISSTDVILNGNQSQPHGLVDYLFNIHKLKPGEHFDVLAGLVFDAKATKKVKSKRGQFGDEKSVESHELQPLLEKQNADNQRKVGMPKKLNTMTEETESNTNEPGPSRNTRYRPKEREHENFNNLKFLDFLKFLEENPTYKYFGLHKVFSDDVGIISIIKMNFDGLENFQYNNYLDNLDINLLRNKLNYLTDDEKSLINNHDFRTINTDVTKPVTNCLACSFAEIMKLNLETVQRYIKQYLDPDDPDAEYKPLLCLNSLKKGKFVNFKTSHVLKSVQDINTYLKSNAKYLENKQLMLQQVNDDYSKAHAVILKFKMVKDNPEPVKLIFDFQFPGFIQPDMPNPYRFQTFIDTNFYKNFVIYDINVFNQ